MRSIFFYYARFFSICVVATILCFGAEASVFTFHHENVLGTSMELRVESPSADKAAKAEAKALNEIERLNAILSGHDAQSVFSKWQRGELNEPLPVELLNVLEACESWRNKTHGAFDPRVESISQVWKEAVKQNKLPSPETIESLRTQISSKGTLLDAQGTPSMQMSLDGLAKSYVIDQVINTVLADTDLVSGVLLDIGGDMRAQGKISAKAAIADPFEPSETGRVFPIPALENRAIATSGNYARYYEVEGKRYSHIIDPRTAQPVDHIVSATVSAPTAVTADALATALSVLSLQEGTAIADSIEGVSYILISADGKTTKSADWEAKIPERILMAAAEEPEDKTASVGSSKDNEGDTSEETEAGDAEAEAKTDTPWGEAYELEIDFDLGPAQGSENTQGGGQTGPGGFGGFGRPGMGGPGGFGGFGGGRGGGYRRPYVAIWCNNEEGYPVRTLVLWHMLQRERWFDSLRRWNRDDAVRKREEKTELATVISRATRPAGNYKVVWDGKDNNGEWVPAGKYTLYIEVTREHGTYQLITTEIEVGGEGFEKDLEANPEISKAKLTYRPVTKE